MPGYSYTAEAMLAEADAKMDSNDPTSEALKLVPIPELKEDMSNYDHWYYAMGFHLEFYGLKTILMVKDMRMRYWEGGPLPTSMDFKTTADWHRWQRHCLHAYSIIYSQATKVIESIIMFWGKSRMPSYDPHELLDLIEVYKESESPEIQAYKATKSTTIYKEILQLIEKSKI